MTSSGTYNFSITVAEGVLGAFERIQVRAPTLRQEHMVTARREVNLLFSEWANKQVNLWKVELETQVLTAGTATYTLPSRVVMILDAYITTGTAPNQTNRYITPLSRTEYASLANPSTQGSPTQYWFDRLITPTITFWPVPDSGGPYTLGYYTVSQIQDANLAGGETPDLPLRWFDAMVAGLAHRLARIYAPTMEAMRKVDAKEAWETAAAQDTEDVNVDLALPISRYYPR